MLGVVLVLVYFGMALLAAAIILQPDRFSVTRAAVMAAPPQQVFPHINELRKWEAWSPWARLDPAAQIVYAGPPAGEGASFEWRGDKKAGAGRMTVVESRPFERVRLNLEMRKTFSASHDVVFLLTPEAGERTMVAWTQSGRNTLMSKAINLLTNREKRLGDQFERGLSNLDAVCR